MKTAISVPDGTFARATRRASDLGISRSQLFATAVDRYLDELDRQSVIEQINAVLDSARVPDDSAQRAVAVGRRLVGADANDGW